MARNDIEQHGEQGFTLVEAATSVSLLVAILGVTYVTADAVTTVNRANQSKLKEDVGFRRSLHGLRDELRLTSTEPDPKTNVKRYSITAHGNSQMIKFQTLVGATMQNQEAVPVWSTPITVLINDKSQLVRIQDGKRRVIASGYLGIWFNVTVRGTFVVATKTYQRDPKSGERIIVNRKYEVRALGS